MDVPFFPTINSGGQHGGFLSVFFPLGKGLAEQRHEP
jgi:hypothetical protein